VAGNGTYFPAGAIWSTVVTDATVDPQSAEIIAWLDQRGWGIGRFQIDFSLDVLHADAATALQEFVATDDFFQPDCDRLPVPVPAGGNVEGEDGYACLGDGDCHLIVVDDSRRRLFEMWRADIRGTQFRGGCLAVCDLARVYDAKGRGLQCTSADAAGYPIAPLLFTADEVAAGSIAHAIRFILPNSSIRRGEIVPPATHGTSATSGPLSAPPYGARLRLRRDYPLASLPNEAARVVARALQRYGMFLADGGRVPLTAQSDRHTRAKWEGLLGSRDLAAIRPGDFEVLRMQDPMPLSDSCVREP
jgi:serine/threonine-protein kinase